MQNSDFQQDNGPDAKAVAERLAKVWRGGAERALSLGIGEREVGRSMLAIAVERMLAVEPAEQVAATLALLVEQIMAEPEPASPTH